MIWCAERTIDRIGSSTKSIGIDFRYDSVLWFLEVIALMFVLVILFFLRKINLSTMFLTVTYNGL